MKKLKPVVEALFRVWIEWDIRAEERDDPDCSDVNKRIHALKHPRAIHISDGEGACWDAMTVITGPHKASVEKHAKKVLRLMARYKRLTVVSGAS